MAETIVLQVDEKLTQSENLIALLRKMNVKEDVLKDITSVTMLPPVTGKTQNTQMQVHILPHSPTHKKYRNNLFTTHYNRVPTSFKGMETYSVVINEAEYGVWDGPLDPSILYMAVNKIPYLSNDSRYPFTGQLISLKYPNDAIKVIPHAQSPVYNEETVFNYIYVYDLKSSFGYDNYYQMKFKANDNPPKVFNRWNSDIASEQSLTLEVLDDLSVWADPASFPNMYADREVDVNTLLNHAEFQKDFIKLSTRDMNWVNEKIINNEIVLSSFPIEEILVGRESAFMANMPHGDKVDYNKTVGLWRIDHKGNTDVISTAVTNYVNIRPFHELITYLIKNNTKLKLQADGETYHYVHDLTNVPVGGVYSYPGVVFNIYFKAIKWKNGFDCWEIKTEYTNYMGSDTPVSAIVIDELFRHSNLFDFQRNGKNYKYWPYMTSTGWSSNPSMTTAEVNAMKAAVATSFDNKKEVVRIDNVNNLSIFMKGAVRYLIKPAIERIEIQDRLPGLTPQ